MGLILKNQIVVVAIETCQHLLIQHPIFVQQPGFVNIYLKLQEYIGVTKSG